MKPNLLLTILALVLCTTICYCLPINAFATRATITSFYGFTGSYSLDGSNPQSGIVRLPDGTIFGATYQGGTNNRGELFEITNSGSFEILHSFNYVDGDAPIAQLMLASDGNIYGTTYQGGAYGFGTAFRLSTSGAFTLLHSFRKSEGYWVQTPFVEASDGNLYATCLYGGAYDLGTLFRMSTSGVVTVVHHFSGNSGDGSSPVGSLAIASDGNLYGTTFNSTALFSIFRCSTSGAIQTVYTNTDSSGSGFASGLTAGADGNLYGITYGNSAVFFRLTTQGQFSPLLNLNNTNLQPTSALTLGSDGNFYGATTQYSGSSNPSNGAIYKLSPLGSLSIPFVFPQGSTAIAPQGHVAIGSGGGLYGISQYDGDFGQGTVFTVTLSRQLTVLHTFGASTFADGKTAQERLTIGDDGNLYGTTSSGGTANDGTVFSLSPSGAHEILHAFNDGSVPHDGIAPGAPLTLGSDGNFYGTTTEGGTSATGSNPGLGTIFRVTSTGQETILHSFNSNGLEGGQPSNALTFGSDSQLYGDGHGNQETLFKVSTAGSFTLLDSLPYGSPPFTAPYGVNELALGPDGLLYGTTQNGGANESGALIRISTSGDLNLVTSFPASSFDSTPDSALTVGSDGNFFGSASGNNLDAGAVFNLSTSGSLINLAEFSGLADPLGSNPSGKLCLASDGNLYGWSANFFNYGQIYRLATDGVITPLKSITDESVPAGPVVQGSDGSFYGIEAGGTIDAGPIFKMVHPSPSTSSRPASRESSGRTPPRATCRFGR